MLIDLIQYNVVDSIIVGFLNDVDILHLSSICRAYLRLLGKHRGNAMLILSGYLLEALETDIPIRVVTDKVIIRDSWISILLRDNGIVFVGLRSATDNLYIKDPSGLAEVYIVKLPRRFWPANTHVDHIKIKAVSMTKKWTEWGQIYYEPNGDVVLRANYERACVGLACIGRCSRTPYQLAFIPEVVQNAITERYSIQMSKFWKAYRSITADDERSIAITSDNE